MNQPKRMKTPNYIDYEAIKIEDIKAEDAFNKKNWFGKCQIFMGWI